jgi:FMN phosphatase YigB (HAD superfamily)
MKETLHPHELPAVLVAFPGVALLSLDCFDTLIWRDTHAPRDVFGALTQPNPKQRIWAEQSARTAALVRCGRNEVNIGEIYAELLPNATADDRAAAVAGECAAEARHCFGFAPTIALMCRARARGLKIIVVSDTYLDRSQLAALIAASAGAETLALIDQIFCSSDYGVSKAEGLFGHVLDSVGVAPDRILHLGDNRAADLVAAQAAGIHALHLLQFSDVTVQRLRLEAAVDAVLHGHHGLRSIAYQPHRATLAMGEPRVSDPAVALGFATLGPVLGGFTNWVAAEAQALRDASNGAVHTLFLMRDGYLPQFVHDALHGDAAPSHAIEISRFTAIAVSFRDIDAVLRHVEREIAGDLAALLAQLLFTPDEAQAMLRRLPPADSLRALVAAIHVPSTMRCILQRASALASRFETYIRAQVPIAPGDTLLLVDLGYNGTVQNAIEPFLREVLQVSVAGRYLLLREQELPGLDKRGWIDGSDYDCDTLEALCGNVAVLEQLCAAAQGSVIDYHRNGTPVRAANAIKGRQSDQRDLVQRGCLDFCRSGAARITVRVTAIASDAVRRGAVAALARLMFLPLPHELEVLARFDHDINLGGAETVGLFDPVAAGQQMRQRGLFYTSTAPRMYLPAELRGQGLPASLAMLTQRCFGLDLRYADFCDTHICLPLLIADGHEVSCGTVNAMPTHDGYFLAAIPVGVARFAIGVQFGKLYEWLQIESVRFTPVANFVGQTSRVAAAVADAQPTLEGMVKTAPHLFRCDDHAAFLMVPPPASDADVPLILEIAFRPLVPRLWDQAAQSEIHDTSGATA